MHVLEIKHIFRFGEKPRSYLGLEESSPEYTGTWHYLCYDRDSLIFLACTEDGHYLKNLIKEVEEGLCHLGLHTCWARTVFGTWRQSARSSSEFIT